MSYYPQPSTSYSPPPLQHPIPTHPPAAPPEPPATPGSPSGYMRFTSNPASPGQQYAQTSGYNNPQYGQPQWQSFGAVPAGVGAVPVPGTQPMPPGQPGTAPGFSFPSTWGMNDATAQMGVQLGRSAVAAGQDYMEKNFGQHLLPLSMLKHQFNVSNHYVLKKLQLVLFPWRHKPWTRRIQRSADAQDVGPPRYAPPRDDLNSPDLYIPVMALVTYVLVAAVKKGLKGRFEPEVLGLTASKALAIVVVECAVVRLGCYFLNIQSTGQFMDLLAFGGYKFVGIIVTLIAGMLHSGNLLYWTVFIYCFLANAFFLTHSKDFIGWCITSTFMSQIGTWTWVPNWWAPDCHRHSGFRPRGIYIKNLTLVSVNNFPEEDLSENGDAVQGFFRAWLGMQLQDGRYCIMRKLGWGAFSTVWLVRDFKLERHAALKIMTREATLRIESGESDEIAMLEKITSADSLHKGRRHLLEYYEMFKITGPQGLHQCIVTEVLGTSIQDLRFQTEHCLPLSLIKTVIRQALLGLDYLHTCCGIIHTDITFDNLLLRLADVPAIISREIAVSPSRTHKGFVDLDPSPYIVESQPIGIPLDFSSHFDSRQVEIVIADLGHAHWSHRHSEDYIQPTGLRAPEVILGHPWDQAVDIWSIGCLVVELIAGTPLFAINPFTKECTLDEDHLAQMTDVLGEQFPMDMLNKSRNREKFVKEDGTFIHSVAPRHPNWHLHSFLTAEHSIIGSNEQEIDAAYDFLRRCLRLRPGDRSAAKDLAEDPWLNTNFQTGSPKQQDVIESVDSNTAAH